MQRSRTVTPTAEAVSTSIVISQVYGGGGNAGSTFTNDFIELHNVSGSPVSVAGWSVQYASATGTSWQVTNLTGSIPAGGYYLVQEAVGAGGTTPLPTPDATGAIPMSATAGKVALSNSTTALSGACPSGAAIVDFVGFGTTPNCFEGTGPTPAPSNTTAVLRGGSGCNDTDQNASDFTAGAPLPRNSAVAAFTCGGGGTPTLNINDVALAEGNSGTTTFTFTVSLTAPAGAGGVTFNIATADGTATDADNDYEPRSLTGQTIAMGQQTYTFDVTVNGDTNPEPNETFFVNVTGITGANAGDTQGQGTINNDEISITSIHDIQGNGSASPLVGTIQTTGGIVTATKNNGFFIQTPDAGADADPNTSEGIFVFTSSAPPPAAVVGNSVAVTGTVQEFVPAAAPHQPPVTEMGLVTSTVVLSSGNTLPTPTTITAAMTSPNNMENLEFLEGMRVTVPQLIVCGPTGGNITEPSATVSSTGLFFGVLPGVPRPFREAGVDASLDLPVGAPVTVPRFDTNPERLRIDSDVQPGTTPIDVAAGTTVSNITGPLDYAFVTWTIYPDPGTPPVVGTQPTPQPIPSSLNNEVSVASFNMERFFDTTDDPGTSDPILTSTAFNGRLAKASLIIRNVQRMPDVIGVEEMENLTTLQAVATKINNDAVAAMQPNPNYQAFLSEGNDVGGIDVGFLVKSAKVSVVDVTQVGLSTMYMEPASGMALLNDRPPLVLRATVPNPNGGSPLPFTVIVNHLRSLNGVDDPTDGNRIRTKRREQALFLANYIQGRQAADPLEPIITVGDMNAFQVNDGYVDSIGIIKGTPAPADQVTLFGADVVNPDQVDLVDTLPLSERYSYTFDGNAQVLDHIIVNQAALRRLNRFHYARFDADYPVKLYQDFARVERLSDHDSPVAYFTLAARHKPSDFDGDGRTDFAVFRNSTADWYLSSSLNGAFTAFHFGQSGDVIAPGDFDRDGRVDFSVFRAGAWFQILSQTGNFVATPFGQAGDIPVPASYDGTGGTNYAVYRNGIWYFRTPLGESSAIQWGLAGDIPVPADYDGDGKADVAVFRNGVWYVLQTSNGQSASYVFGQSGDTPVPADYDGDGKADIAVFRGGTWYILNSADNSFRAAAFGLATDVVVPGNYDDDNKTDLAVFRGGNWYVLSSYTNSLIVATFGVAGDTPVPRGYVKPQP
jgi:predicted extracellular nuclease